MLRTALVIAPHLTFPLRNGADILIDKKWSSFSKHIDYVDILCMNVIRRYKNGLVVTEVSFGNINRSKYVSAFRSILKRSHYLLQKNITTEYLMKAVQLLQSEKYDIIVCSLITSAWEILKYDVKLASKIVIETHNDELKWFHDIRYQSNYLPEMLSAYFSELWLKKNLSVFSGCLFIHVSEDDDLGYRKILPYHRSIIVPVGSDEVTDFKFLQTVTCSDADPILIFSGSLNTKINCDALLHFDNLFFPRLRCRFGSHFQLIVAGSNPSDFVRSLCIKNDWLLHVNVCDDKLHELYKGSLFSILPFRYSTGGKLKLLKSLSLGVPFLATSPLSSQLDTLPVPCLISDDPDEWINQIESKMRSGVSDDERLELINLARKYSWSRLAEQMYHQLKLHFIY